MQDSGEPGISGVELELTVSGQSYVVATATTDVGGEYLFNGLPAGSYKVTVASSNFSTGKPLAGATYSTANIGSNDSLDSDFSSSTGSAEVTIANASNYTIDAGFRLSTDQRADLAHSQPSLRWQTTKVQNMRSRWSVLWVIRGHTGCARYPVIT